MKALLLASADRLYRLIVMKKLAVLLGLLACAVLPVAAQVSVEVALDQEQFLPGEPLIAAVRISNRSGRTLHLGEEDYWLTISVEQKGGTVVARTGDIPVRGPFTVESSKRATKRVDLAPYFALGEVGRYEITATVQLKELGREGTSLPKAFNIIEGARLWEQDFGVPISKTGGTGVPEVRKYILQQANYLKGQLRLYLRITDATGDKVVKTQPVGLALSFSNPDPRLDKDSNLHLLYQSWARTFTYVVYTPDGELTLRQTYDFNDTHPRFQVDTEGAITVVGGFRRVTQNDVPAPKAPAVATPPGS
jgi:hypothetical protein